MTTRTCITSSTGFHLPVYGVFGCSCNPIRNWRSSWRRTRLSRPGETCLSSDWEPRDARMCRNGMTSCCGRSWIVLCDDHSPGHRSPLRGNRPRRRAPRGFGPPAVHSRRETPAAHDRSHGDLLARGEEPGSQGRSGVPGVCGTRRARTDGVAPTGRRQGRAARRELLGTAAGVRGRLSDRSGRAVGGREDRHRGQAPFHRRPASARHRLDPCSGGPWRAMAVRPRRCCNAAGTNGVRVSSRGRRGRAAASRPAARRPCTARRRPAVRRSP